MATDYGSFRYPGSVSSSPSVGTNGSTAPTSSDQIGGVGPDGNLHPVSVTNGGVIITTPDPAGVQHVIVDSSALPTGASTAALQTTGNTSLGNIDTSTAAINTKTPTLGQKVMSGSSPVTIASDQSSIPVAATLQAGSAIAGKFGIDQTTPGTTNAVSVTNFPGTQPVSGTVAIGGPLGQAAASTSVSVALANEDVQDLNVTGQSAQTATVNNILTVASGSAATDLNGYRSFSVQVVSTGTGGTFIFEGSNDNTNFIAVPVYNQLILTGTPVTAAVTATSSQIIYQGSAHFRYLRLRIASTITGGSIQAFSKFSQAAFAPGVNQVAQSTAANLNATVTATNLSTNLAQIAAVATAVNNGVSSTGTQRITIASDSTGQFFQAGYTKANTPTYNVYSSTPVTTAAYVQLVASTTSAVRQLQIFDSSGQAMIIATGAAASEVDQIYVPPGGGVFNLAIAASTRVSIKALSANTGSNGYLVIDYLG